MLPFIFKTKNSHIKLPSAYLYKLDQQSAPASFTAEETLLTAKLIWSPMTHAAKEKS